MIDSCDNPPGETLTMGLGAMLRPDRRRWRTLCRAGAISIAGSVSLLATWAMWRPGDTCGAVATAVVTVASAAAAALWQAPDILAGPASRRPDGEPEPDTAPPEIAHDVRKEDLIDARTDEDALRQAEKMETIGRCVGEFAHDFNNLLTVIICNLERASRSAVPGTRAFDYLADATLASERAARLVGDILAFSRRQPAAPQFVEIDALIVAMRPLILSVTNGCVVDFELACTWRCRVAPNQLESAVLNLVVNARDATSQGGRLIIRTFETSVDQDDSSICGGEYVVLAVSDTGVGMAPEVASRASEPFFTTKPVGHGTGLGLSQIAGFAQRAQGATFLKTAPGLGTCVTVFLPRDGSDALKALG